MPKPKKPVRVGVAAHLGTNARGTSQRAAPVQNLGKMGKEDRAEALKEQTAQLIQSLGLDSIKFLGDDDVVDRKKRVLRALVTSLNVVSSACAKSGVSRARFYIYVRDDPEFARITKELDEYTLDFVEQRLYGLIQTGDTAATIFFLKTRGKARGYVERQELTGPNGAPLSMLHMTMNDVKAELPKQALADIYGALVAAGGQGGRESPATFFAKGRGAVDVKSNGKAKTKNEPPRATTARK